MLRSFPYSSRRTYVSQCGLPQTIRQLLASTDVFERTVTVHGWLRSIRLHKNVAFLDVNDGTTFSGLQAVLLHRPNGLTTGTSVRLTGQLIQSPGKGQDLELRVENIEVLGECDQESYPIQKKELSLELMRDKSHLRARMANTAAVLRIRDKVSRTFNGWFEKEGFVYAHAPVMTSIDCEGAGEAYRVVSDAQSGIPSASGGSQILSSPPTYLTTSTQLHLEALTAAFSRVYTLAPSFRAERSQTNRHLGEFWMLEAEMSFLSAGVDSICDVAESSLKAVIASMNNDEDVVALRTATASTPTPDVWDTWADPSTRWRRVTYTEALRALDAHQASEAEPRFAFTPPKWGEALRSEHERWIAQFMGFDGCITRDKMNSARAGGPVFVTNFPRASKPFYMWVNDSSDGDARETVACFDLLVPRVAEITGGSVRESRLEVLRKSMTLRGMDEVNHSWYLDLRRYGTTHHGGFGIGFDRLVSWISGIDNVRECIAFPRWAGRVPL